MTPSPEWIDRQRQAAGVTEDEDPTPYLQALSDWQEKAQEVADQAPRHGTKKAVEQVTLSDVEARAAFSLYALAADQVFFVTRDAFRSFVYSEHQDEPHQDLEDILSEGYILFLRALVRWEGEKPLSHHVNGAFRDRVRDHIESKLSVPDDPDNRAEIEDGGMIAPSFDLVSIYEGLIEEGKTTPEAEALWERVRE